MSYAVKRLRMSEEQDSTPAATSFISQARKHLPLILVLLYFGVLFNGVLFMTQGAYERDAFYHARYSQMLPERGLSREFRWMQFVEWKDAFGDKDFLYHVVLMPFACLWPEALDGAKVGTLLLALVLLASVYVFLWRFKAPWPLLWVILLAVGGGFFLIRLLMVRSHCLSIILMVAALYVILRGRFWPCFTVAFLYAWSYSFPVAMLVTAVAAELGRTFLCHGYAATTWRLIRASCARMRPRQTTGGHRQPIPAGAGIGVSPRLVPRTVLATALGLGAGLLFHPYSPNSLRVLWLFLNVSAAGAVGSPIELGSEFAGLDLASLVLGLPGLLLALVLAVTGAALLLRRGLTPISGSLEIGCLSPPGQGCALSAESAAALGVALAWFASMFVFSRMVEYFAPMTVLAAALVARDWSGGGLSSCATDMPPQSGGLSLLPAAGTDEAAPNSRRSHIRGTRRPRVLAFMLICALLLAGLHELSFYEVRARVRATRQHFPSDEAWYRGRYFDGAAEWMRKNLKPRETVINFHWDDFPELFYSAPFQNYIVGLDPTFMRLKYPKEAAVLEAMRIHAAPLDFGKLGRLLNSEYVIMRRYRAQTYRMSKDRVIQPVYEDETAVVYRTSS